MTDWTAPSNYDPDDLPPWERAAMRRASLAGLITPRRIFWAVAIVGLVIYLAANWQYALVAAGITGDTTPDQTATAPDQATTGAAMDRLMAIAEMDGNPMRAAYNLGTIEKTLDTTDQAQRLYLLLQKYPGKMAYLLGYVCGDEFTTLGYLVKTRELVRVRINLDGHVTGELWQEHAVDRLKNAANGGSLDDTPKGKRPGGFVSLRANPEGRAK